MSEAVGAVKALWRFPVKSMRGAKVEAADLTEAGLAGDRAYALVDADNGEVMTGKAPKLGPKLFRCRAEFVEAPGQGDEPPPVRITLPDGSSVRSDAPDVHATLSGFLGRPVTLERAAPPEFSAGAFFDLFPVSVLTTSTLDRLRELGPGSRFDERRFRMNVIVDTRETGFVENGWTGHRLRIGDAVQLGVTIPDPRCVMTTLAQDELPKDPGVLRTLARENKLEVAGGLYPCAGVYAVVASGGTIRTGDRVSLM
ncbi:MAG: MOSC domain-containing protein [Acidimicrobiia bacterium]